MDDDDFIRWDAGRGAQVSEECSRHLNDRLREWIVRNGAGLVAASQEAVEDYTYAGVTCFSEPRIRPLVESAMRDRQVALIDEHRQSYVDLLRSELISAAAQSKALRDEHNQLEGRSSAQYDPSDESLSNQLILFQQRISRRRERVKNVIQYFFHGTGSATPLPLDVHASLLQFVEEERADVDRGTKVVNTLQKRLWDLKMAPLVAPPLRGKKLWEELRLVNITFDLPESDHSSDDDVPDDEAYSQRVVLRRSQVVLSRLEEAVLKRNEMPYVGVFALLGAMTRMEEAKTDATALRQRLLHDGTSPKKALSNALPTALARTVESLVFAWAPDIYVSLCGHSDLPTEGSSSLLPHEALSSEWDLRTDMFNQSIEAVGKAMGGSVSSSPVLMTALRPMLVPMKGVVSVLYGCTPQSRGEVPADGSYLGIDDAALSTIDVDDRLLHTCIHSAFPTSLSKAAVVLQLARWVLGVGSNSLPTPTGEKVLVLRLAALAYAVDQQLDSIDPLKVSGLVREALGVTSVSEEVDALLRRKQLMRATFTDEMRRRVEGRALNSFIPVVCAGARCNPFHSYHHWGSQGRMSEVLRRACLKGRDCDALHRLLASHVNTKALPVVFGDSFESCRRAQPQCPPTLITNPLHPPAEVPVSELLQEVLENAVLKFNLSRYRSTSARRTVAELHAVLFSPLVPLTKDPSAPTPDPNLLFAGPLLCSLLFWFVFNSCYNPVIVPAYSYYYFDLISLCMGVINSALVSMKLESVFSFATKHEEGRTLTVNGMSHHSQGESAPMDFLPYVIIHTVHLGFMRLFPNNADLFSEAAFIEPTSQLLFRLFSPQKALSKTHFKDMRDELFSHPSISIDALVCMPTPTTTEPVPTILDTLDTTVDGEVEGASAWPSPTQYNASIKGLSVLDRTVVQDEDIHIFNHMAMADPITAQAMLKARRDDDQRARADAGRPQTEAGAELALVVECSQGGIGNRAGDIRRVRKLRILQERAQQLLLPAPVGSSTDTDLIHERAMGVFKSMCARHGATSPLLGDLKRMSIASVVSMGGSSFGSADRVAPPLSAKRLSMVINAQRRRSTIAFDLKGRRNSVEDGNASEEDLPTQIGRLVLQDPPGVHQVAFTCASGFSQPHISNPLFVADLTRSLAKTLRAVVLEDTAGVASVLGEHLFGSPVQRVPPQDSSTIPPHHQPCHSPSVYDVPQLTTVGMRKGIPSSPASTTKATRPSSHRSPSNMLCADPDELHNFTTSRTPTRASKKPSVSAYSFNTSVGVSSICSPTHEPRTPLPPLRPVPSQTLAPEVQRNTALLTIGDRLDLTACSPSMQRGHPQRSQNVRPIRQTLTSGVEMSPHLQGSQLAQMIRDQSIQSASATEAVIKSQHAHQRQALRSHHRLHSEPTQGPLEGLRRSEFVDDWVSREPPKVGSIDFTAELRGRGRGPPVPGLKEGTMWEGTQLAVAAKSNAVDLNDTIKRAERALQRRRGKRL